MAYDYSSLLVEERKDHLWVTINRPRDRNSINSPLMNDIERLLEKAEKSSTRAVVFAGAGDSYFIGGADGIEMMQLDQQGALDFSGRIQRLFDRMEESPLVLVAAIDGLCFGGGFEFAMACDLRVASEESRIGLPEVKVGLIPGGGGTQRLPRLVGMGVAKDMILSGRLYKAGEAHSIGLVNYISPRNRLEEEVHTVLERILRNPQYALALAKKAVNSYQAENLHEGLRAESDAFSRCFSHDYFVKLMMKQLRDGILKTTTVLPDRFSNGGK